MRVLVPDYRRAPEHPFPYPLYDAISSYLSLIDAGYDASSQIYLVGDSAGGGMVMALLLWLKVSFFFG